MAAAAVLPTPTPGTLAHDVTTTLNYFKHLPGTSFEEEAYRYIYMTPPPGKLEHNLGDDPQPVVVHDARGREHEFALDTHGFQFVRHVSVEREFVDEERIKDVYYKEAEQLLKEVTGAKRALIFDHTIRFALCNCGKFIRRWLTCIAHPQTSCREGWDRTQNTSSWTCGTFPSCPPCRDS